MKELNEQDLQLIIQNMEQNLTPKEQLHFRQKYDSDSEFKKEADVYMDAFDAIRLAGKARVKSILREEAGKYQTEAALQPEAKIRKITPNRVWISRIAAAAVLAGVSVFGYLTLHRSDTDQLMAQNFKPVEINIFESFRNNDPIKIDPDFQKRHSVAAINLAKSALDAYDDKNYREAVRLLSEIQEKDDTLSLYEATAYLALRQTTPAKTILSGLEKSSGDYVRDAAPWYLALAELQDKHMTAVQALLQKIISQSQKSPYFKEASQLMEELKGK